MSKLQHLDAGIGDSEKKVTKDEDERNEKTTALKKPKLRHQKDSFTGNDDDSYPLPSLPAGENSECADVSAGQFNCHPPKELEEPAKNREFSTKIQAKSERRVLKGNKVLLRGFYFRETGT